MKRTSLSLLICCISLASYSQRPKLTYSIDGHIKGLSSGKMYFAVFGPSRETDSVEIKNGNFLFKGTLQEPSPVILSLARNYVNKPLFMLFVDEGHMEVDLNKDDLRNGKATGTAATDDHELLKSIEKPFDDQLASARHLLADTSKPARDEWEKISSTVLKNRKAAQAAFIKAHPSSPVAAWATHRNFSYSPEDAVELEKLFSGLSPALHYTTYASDMKQSIEKLKMLAIGNLAPDFTQNDTLDKPVSLSDFRGKYVLVDFWASWCKPCRADNPNVVKAFTEYKDRRFTVLSVSLDQPGKKDAWLAAIHKDGLAWTHVSDLKFWDNAVARQYGIRAIPANLLLDPNGRIIAKDLHEGKLAETLQGILK